MERDGLKSMYSKIICIYHMPCNDGLTSAWVFDKWAKGHLNDKPGFIDDIPYEIMGCAYETGVDFEKCRDALVYFIDFSVKREAMIKLAGIAKKIIVIDHHKTAQESLAVKGLPTNIEVHFDMKQCGCTLAWQYFFPGHAVPSFLGHIEDNDIWTKELTYIEEFVAWLDNYNPKTIEDMDFAIQHWESDYKSCVNIGSQILSYKNALITSILGYAFETTLGGVKVVKINSPYNKLNSELGMRLAKLWQMPSWIWHEAQVEDGKVLQKNSLRSLDHLPDVSELAKKFGGGGHRNASGFVGVGCA